MWKLGLATYRTAGLKTSVAPPHESEDIHHLTERWHLVHGESAEIGQVHVRYHIAEPQYRHAPKEEDESVLHLTALLDAEAVDNQEDGHQAASYHAVVYHGDVYTQSTHQYLEIIREGKRLACADANHRDDILPAGYDGPHFVKTTLGIIICTASLRQHSRHLAINHTGPDAHQQREKGKDYNPRSYQSYLSTAARKDTDTHNGANGHTN